MRFALESVEAAQQNRETLSALKCYFEIDSNRSSDQDSY